MVERNAMNFHMDLTTEQNTRKNFVDEPWHMKIILTTQKQTKTPHFRSLLMSQRRSTHENAQTHGLSMYEHMVK